MFISEYIVVQTLKTIYLLQCSEERMLNKKKKKSLMLTLESKSFCKQNDQ